METPIFASPVSRRAVNNNPLIVAKELQKIYARKSIYLVLIPERDAALMLPPTE
jgi:hypothetical protein